MRSGYFKRVKLYYLLQYRQYLYCNGFTGKSLITFSEKQNPGYFDNIITPNGQSVSTTEDSDFDYIKDNNNPIIKTLVTTTLSTTLVLLRMIVVK